MDEKTKKFIEKGYDYQNASIKVGILYDRTLGGIQTDAYWEAIRDRNAVGDRMAEAARELPFERKVWQSLPDPNAEAHWIWVTMPAGENYITLWRGKTTVEAWPECLFCPIEKPEPPKAEGEKT